MDEAEVIHRCQRGERDAFRFIVERYGKVLYGTAYMMTRDRALAEDMVQEAFLLAWRNISSFRLGTSFKPESTEGRPWGQSLKKPEGAPLNLG